MPINGARKSLRGLILRHIVGQMLGRSKLHTEIPQGRDHGGQHLVIGARHSVYVRHLDCGSCNGCEVELSALENPVYDFGHLGFEFKASPRHADVLILTGPYTRNLDEAARRTFAAMPTPRRILAIGDCAAQPCASAYAKSYALAQRPNEIEQAIVTTVTGCPPTPKQILEGLISVQALMQQDGLRVRLTNLVRACMCRIPWKGR